MILRLNKITRCKVKGVWCAPNCVINPSSISHGLCASLCNLFHVFPIFGQIFWETPWIQQVVSIWMKCEEELAVCFQALHDVTTYLRFLLGECWWTMVSFSTIVFWRANFVPMEIIISICVNSETWDAIGRTCLSPQAVNIKGIFVAIWVDNRLNHKVQFIQKLWEITLRINKSINQIEGSCWCNPFTCMNSCIYENRIFRSAVAVGDGDSFNIPTLERFTNRFHYHFRIGFKFLCQIVEMLVDFFVPVVAIKW